MAQPKQGKSGPTTRAKTKMKKPAATAKASRGKKSAPVRTTRRKRQASDNEESADSESDDTSCHPRRKRSQKHVEEEVVEDKEPAESEVEVVDNEASNEEAQEESPETEDEPQHKRPVAGTMPVKKQSTKDLLLVMTDRVEVKFKVGENDYKSLTGRWCIPCKNDAAFHYELYKDKCNEAEIPENHWAIPRDIWPEMEDAKRQEKAKRKVQAKLEFEKVPGPQVFTREGVLHAVTQFVAIDDQSLVLPSKPIFRNCLVVMRPNATKADLPSKHDVQVHLHNEFVERLQELKASILKAPGKISVTADAWSADTTKASFLGMTAHWIDIEDGHWKLRAEVIAFQGLSGNHSGLNLGRCLGHVVNLGNVSVMSHITKIAAVETTTAIWEYDPTDPDNRILGGDLDVIAALRTLMVKIQASGQRIEYFEQCQVSCKISDPLKIPLHSNIRWGTAHLMVTRGHYLRQPMTLFMSTADELYGPITTLRQNGCVVKHIPWSAFKLSDTDWDRVLDASKILEDSNRIQQCFSAEKQPTLWNALPALEELQTAWEEKRDDPHYAPYRDALSDGLAKLNKYYSFLDEKSAFVLALVKTGRNWSGNCKKTAVAGCSRSRSGFSGFGNFRNQLRLPVASIGSQKPDRTGPENTSGKEEQAAEIGAGNKYAKNWQEEAMKILDRTAAAQPMASTSAMPTDKRKTLSDFNRHRQALISQDDQEGWASELRRYLKDVPAEVSKDTDIVKWWQNHSKASSVPCERLFLASKQTATERRARLGAKTFEELQLMKFAWRNNIRNIAAWNSDQVEEVNLIEFTEMLELDEQNAEWDKDGFKIVVD
ncbi:hypothetical protein Hypma_003461 [Hypsizygus marmoreus]|uniref:HAT C-terminal dimerisation domain-containing protein n=1 Tax=Hypsizygus marmoreus TaxID=39966 RepID=A0A369J4F1_HYPMA|nr:hypothetical protein Hypma_003461 [Hypsizygus marmoreus]